MNSLISLPSCTRYAPITCVQHVLVPSHVSTLAHTLNTYPQNVILESVTVEGDLNVTYFHFFSSSGEKEKIP
jgi:hypothetical protein